MGEVPKFSHYYHQPSDSTRASKPIAASVPEKKSDSSTLKNIFSLVVFIGVLYGMSQLASAMEESMQNSLPGSKDPHATDPFDRIFGSEFNTKFKNNSRNKGLLKGEAEKKKKAEIAKQNFRKKGTTSTVKEVCEYVANDKDITNLLQKFASNDIDEGMRILKTARMDLRRIGPMAFQGYTFREIIGDTHEGRNIARLRLASAYFLDCLMTNQSQEISITSGSTKTK